METVNLLEFLNKAKDLYTLDYAVCGDELVNFLDMMTEDVTFTKKIDLGIIYLHQRNLDQFTIIDGLNRLLSLSLLLHAVCECYKKTSAKNDKAIRIIRSKYLLDGQKTKLKLQTEEQVIFDKILFGEKLSGKEKQSPLFVLLHNFWTQIKEEKLQAANIFAMLGKLTVYIVDTENVSKRDLFYNLNKNNPKVNQLLLIEDYLKSLGILNEWKELNHIFNNKTDIMQFFRDFFITKFNYKELDYFRLYEIFVNYFETMLQYMPEDTLIKKIIRSAKLYDDILNVNFYNEKFRQALIQIKMHKGEDTYAYILNIYEDYMDENITESTFLEILSTIDEYLKNRLKTPNDVSFNELIKYLNAFITCK